MSGITPTYMGNTFCTIFLGHHDRDHPHVHGEYNYTIKLPNGAQGSPPRTWGIPPNSINSADTTGITPTYMGNTLDPFQPVRSGRDHPHVHGEYVIAIASFLGLSGSPPRTWGIHDPKTVLASRSRDHPHVHGEYDGARYSSCSAKGSPPRTWGIP